jgi:outer membrane protein TolC
MNGRRVPVGVLVLVFALACLPWPSIGQDSASARLSLDQCRKIALENNLSLVSEMKSPEISAAEIDVAEAPFDPTLGASGDFTRSEVDQKIDAIGVDPGTGDIIVTGTTKGEQTADVWNAGITFSHLLAFGGTYTAEYNIGDIDFAGLDVQRGTNFITDSIFTQRTDGMILSYQMPLLQGFGTEVNKELVLLAQGNLDLSNEELRRIAIETIQQVEDAYWDVVGAQAALRISRLALERAEDLLELNKKKVEVGTLAPIEITQAEAGVASQVGAVIQAENLIENAEDILLALLAVPEDSPLWNQSLDLYDRPSFEPVEIDVDAALAEALNTRPEMESARVGLRNSELSERVAKRRVKHGLDLFASISPADREDSQQLVAFPGQPLPDTGSRQDQDMGSWNLGLTYRYPLRNREAKANYAKARYQKERSSLNVQDWEQTVRVEVRTAIRALDSGIKLVEAERQSVILQQKKLDAEQKKFDNGMSTSFEVLTFQNDLADAELKEIEARLDFVKAKTELERAKGTLLSSRGLTLGE